MAVWVFVQHNMFGFFCNPKDKMKRENISEVYYIFYKKRTSSGHDRKCNIHQECFYLAKWMRRGKIKLKALMNVVRDPCTQYFLCCCLFRWFNHRSLWVELWIIYERREGKKHQRVHQTLIRRSRKKPNRMHCIGFKLTQLLIQNVCVFLHAIFFFHSAVVSLFLFSMHSCGWCDFSSIPLEH